MTTTTKEIKCACPACNNTVLHTLAAKREGTGNLYECNSCGAFSTLEQLAAAEQRINRRELDAR